MSEKSFKEINCTTAFFTEDEDGETEYRQYKLGTPVVVFEDVNAIERKRAFQMGEKEELWVACFSNRNILGYGLVCGENRVLFRMFGSEQ